MYTPAKRLFAFLQTDRGSAFPIIMLILATTLSSGAAAFIMSTRASLVASPQFESQRLHAENLGMEIMALLGEPSSCTLNALSWPDRRLPPNSEIAGVTIRALASPGTLGPEMLAPDLKKDRVHVRTTRLEYVAPPEIGGLRYHRADLTAEVAILGGVGKTQVLRIPMFVELGPGNAITRCFAVARNDVRPLQPTSPSASPTPTPTPSATSATTQTVNDAICRFRGTSYVYNAETNLCVIN